MRRLTQAQRTELDLEKFLDAQEERRTVTALFPVAPAPRDYEEQMASDLVGTLMGATSTLIER